MKKVNTEKVLENSKIKKQILNMKKVQHLTDAIIAFRLNLPIDVVKRVIETTDLSKLALDEFNEHHNIDTYFARKYRKDGSLDRRFRETSNIFSEVRIKEREDEVVNLWMKGKNCDEILQKVRDVTLTEIFYTLVKNSLFKPDDPRNIDFNYINKCTTGVLKKFKNTLKEGDKFVVRSMPPYNELTELYGSTMTVTIKKLYKYFALTDKGGIQYFDLYTGSKVTSN